MKFTEEHAAKALRDLGIDFAQENSPCLPWWTG